MLDLFSADGILKYFLYFCQKIGLDISCKLFTKDTMCMNNAKAYYLEKLRRTSICCLLTAHRVIKVEFELTLTSAGLTSTNISKEHAL